MWLHCFQYSEVFQSRSEFGRFGCIIFGRRMRNDIKNKSFSYSYQSGLTYKYFFCFFQGPFPASFSVYLRLFNMPQFKLKFKLIKVLMVCLVFEPGAAGLIHRATTAPLTNKFVCYQEKAGPTCTSLRRTFNFW